jgi:two-component system response regulator RegA
MPTKKILLVDDDDVLRTRLEKSLTRRGYQVVCAADGNAALSAASTEQPDLAVLDLKMPGRAAMDVLVELRQRLPQIKVVILTGYGSIANAVEAIKLGATSYVTKPADADQLLAAFEEMDGSAARTVDPDFPPPSLSQAEWQHIQRVLADAGGNISEAARRLDIPRRTLQRKLKKMAP